MGIEDLNDGPMFRRAVVHDSGGYSEQEGWPFEHRVRRDGEPRDDEVLVCLVASGICRTDIDFCDNWDETDGAVVLGHEGAGVIERIGKRVRGVKPGDHVVLSYKFRDINRAIADAKRGDTIKPVLRISKE